MTYIHPDDAIGKTVAKVHDTGDGLIIAFTDDTYIYAQMKDSYGEYYFSVHQPFEIDTSLSSANSAREIGIISQAEYDAIRRQKDEADKSRRKLQFEELQKEFR